APAPPRRDAAAEPLAHDRRLERAAVEEERVRSSIADVGTMAGEELRDVARDLGLLRERQAELAEREAGRTARPRVDRDVREEAVEHRRLDLGAADRPAEAAAGHRR